MQKDFICFGHRGAMGYAPENTLLSIQKALDLNVDYVEIDVYEVENRLVVIHDERFERTTNGEGYITECSLEYARSLDAGNGEKIPYLEEVLDLIDGRIGINIELKGYNTAIPVVKVVDNYLKKNSWNSNNFLLSSFNHYEIFKAKQLNSNIRIGALTGSIPVDYAAFGEKLNAYSVHLNLNFVTDEYVSDAHKRGLKVFVYTVNHPEDILRMRKMNVDGVFTNYPDRVNMAKVISV